MEGAHVGHHGLRLVGLGPATGATARTRVAPAHTPSPEEHARATNAVERETRLAANLNPSHVRTVFAELVASRLQGGKAAILPSEARERLLDAAQRFGLRPFDATLIIALVQDGARRGEAVGVHAKALLEGGPWSSTGSGRERRGVRLAAIIATVLATGGIFAALVAWANTALNG